jgi:hypothetical protein
MTTENEEFGEESINDSMDKLDAIRDYLESKKEFIERGDKEDGK